MPNAVRLLEELPPHQLPAELVALAEEAAGCRVGLYVADIGGTVLRLVAGEGWPTELPLAQALGTELTRGRMGEIQQEFGAMLDGAAAVPLWLHGRAIAVLVCEQRPRQALEPLARQAAAAVELADSYTDVFHRARRRQSTSPAAELQENLLPPRFALFEGAEVAAGIVPAYDVGGDWYDHAQNPEGGWIAVADAAGKGPSSAGVSSVALGAFRAARRSGLGLAEAARGIDAALASLEETTFATAVIARWHGATRTLEWLRFGHPYPLLLHADGSVERLEDSNNLPLGLLGTRAAQVEPASVVLEPGDRLVLYSDGVSERRLPGGGFFTEAGIVHALGGSVGDGAAGLATALVDAVMAVAPDEPRDDATVLVLAVDPA